ncbi:MAG: response regulator transcription factor [Chloroflexota bacterium]|nr:response regulator transcription factor [Chloroflexota bacterium]
MARILVVEDERDLNDLVARHLRQEGHEAMQAFDGPDALIAVAAAKPDLVVLDWMLPGLDGITVCRKLREQYLVPILMLTARVEEADIILGLEVGADDYLTKPFRMRELVARVRALLRRVELDSRGLPIGESEPSPFDTDMITVGPISVSPDMRTALINDAELDLTPKEFDLLVLFASNPGRAFSRDYLLERIWSNEYEVTDRTVDTHVQRLRKKLGDDAGLIRTVWGIGYKLQAQPAAAQRPA